MQTTAQFLFESRRGRGPAAWQRTDHQLIGLAELAEQTAGHMAQSAGDPVAFHGGSDRLADNQPDLRSAVGIVVLPAAEVNDDIGLCHANSVLHRRVKVN